MLTALVCFLKKKHRSEDFLNCYILLMHREHCYHMNGIMHKSKKAFSYSQRNVFRSTSTVITSQTVFNHHQPPKSTFGKSITKCQPRMQHFFMKLHKYDCLLEYPPGKPMVVSDILSRANLNHQSTKTDQPD